MSFIKRITKATLLAPVRVIEGAVEAFDEAVNGPNTATDTTNHHDTHQELRARSAHCKKCRTDTSVIWLA